MGNLRACFAVATLALAACGSDPKQPDAGITLVDSPNPDAKVWNDAPPKNYDFTCMGNSAPTTASAQITLSGTVQQVSLSGMTPQVDPVDGATVVACDATASACTGQDLLGTTTTDAQGAFSIGPQSTGSTPVDAYLQMTKTNVRTVLTYPSAPFVADQGSIPMLSFGQSFIDVLGFLGCPQDDTTNGIIAVVVTDCADMPIDDSSNVMLVIKQGGTAVSGTSVVNLGMLQAQLAGSYLVCNVPENATTEVGATWKTMALRAHNVKVVAGATTATILRPGY